MTGTYRRISIDPYLARNPEAAAYLRPDFTDFATSRWEDDEVPASRRGRAIVRSWDFLPLDVTTCRELVPAGFWLNPVYDVNGYYRALGIGWPFRPTKRELMRGYQAVDGQSDEFATYAFKRLLDKEIRAAYDARPYGQPMDDKYRWLELSRKAARWAAEETMRSGRYRDSSEFVPADIRARMESDMRREGDQTESIREVPAVDWGFGYYRWDAIAIDKRVLQEWQRLLLRELWDRKITGRITVGVMADQGHSAIRLHHEGYDIAFLDEGVTPSPELAERVVRSVLTTPLNEEFDTPITFDLVTQV